jgi:hypothetical protein
LPKAPLSHTGRSTPVPLTTDGGGNIVGVGEATSVHNATVGNGTFVSTDSVTGQFGQGLRFNGDNNLVFPNLTELMQSNGAPSYTVSMWIQWPAAAVAPGGATPFATLGNWGNGPAGTAGVNSRFTYGFGPNAATSIRGQTRYAAGASGTDIYARTTNTAAVNNGVWHMMTWTFNTSSGALNVYYDGAFVETFNSAAASFQLSDSTSATASMGLKADNNTFLTGDVRLDEVWVLTQILSADEVQSLFTSNAIPEPTGIALLGAGVMGLLGRRRRRN